MNHESFLRPREALYWKVTKWYRDTRKTTQFAEASLAFTLHPRRFGENSPAPKKICCFRQPEAEWGRENEAVYRREYRRESERRAVGKREEKGALLGIPVTFQVVYKVTRVGREEKRSLSLAAPLFRSRSIIRRCTKETDGIVTRRVVTYSRVAGEIH